MKSYESTVSAFEALNAPKSFLYVLARLKLRSLLFSAKNSRIFDFQILKMARLKVVNTRSVPTCAISSMDPKVTSPMISKHSDTSRPRNAPFFGKQWLLYVQKIQQNAAYFEAKVKHYSLHCQTIHLGCRYDVSDVYGGLLQLRHQYSTISNAPKVTKCYLLGTKYHISILVYASYLNKLSLLFKKLNKVEFPIVINFCQFGAFEIVLY